MTYLDDMDRRTFPGLGTTHTAVCPHDTDGDGNCGKPLCPVCHPDRWEPRLDRDAMFSAVKVPIADLSKIASRMNTFSHGCERAGCPICEVQSAIYDLIDRGEKYAS